MKVVSLRHFYQIKLRHNTEDTNLLIGMVLGGMIDLPWNEIPSEISLFGVPEYTDICRRRLKS